MINVFQPTVGAAEMAAVGRVFRSGWLGRGEKAAEFEEALAGLLGVPSVLSINSCTTGLFLSLRLLGVGDGDEVVVPSIHFVGAANAIVSAGARPVFCDVDPHTLNTSVSYVERMVTDRTRAVLLLHYGGGACDVEPVLDLAFSSGFRVVEDAACALGSKRGGRVAGTFGDVGVWSFDAMKMLTTAGDGGAIYCKEPSMRQEAREALWFGLDQARGVESDQAQWWEFDVNSDGRYGLMNDVQAAVGLAQLKRFREFRDKRLALKGIYDERLREVPFVRLPEMEDGAVPHFYWVQVEAGRDGLAHHLRREGVYTTFRYWPLHLVDFYGHPEKMELPNAERAAATTLLLPMHCNLSDDDVHMVCDLIEGWKPRTGEGAT